MPKLPSLSGKELIRVLEKSGFQVVRRRKSHVSLQKGTYRNIVPLHHDLAKGTLLGILKQCGLTKNDLINLIKKA